MDRTEAAEDRKKSDGRDPFERFVEAANQLVSRGPFFLVMVIAIEAWAVSYPFWSSATTWELALHTGSAILSLLLLALLENAGRRSQEAIQEKLNVVAEALAALMASRASDDAELSEAVEKLRQAIALEERH